MYYWSMFKYHKRTFWISLAKFLSQDIASLHKRLPVLAIGHQHSLVIRETMMDMGRMSLKYTSQEWSGVVQRLLLVENHVFIEISDECNSKKRLILIWIRQGKHFKTACFNSCFLMSQGFQILLPLRFMQNILINLWIS